MWIEPTAHFMPENYNSPIIGIASQLKNHNSGIHQHDLGQLLFSGKGSIKLCLEQAIYVLPPARLAWIPAGVSHQAIMHDVVNYRSIYLDRQISLQLPDQLCVFSCTAVLSALLERIAFLPFSTDWDAGVYPHLLAVFLYELKHAPHENFRLALPSDKRLAHIDWNRLPPTLQVLAKDSAASERTLSRIFIKETGLNYQRWRQQWRLLKAIELLTYNTSLLDIALELGFSNDSAFSTFFKSMTGKAPRQYIETS
ncbi:helix-turn-helix transcriptional regulator [Pseudomonas sp. F1_0610]|uniref:AraC family transcriptional regulator n=1 Tax=Pseudomonas sp. F1_0610 TaxID=3114284 RepID=UPI0039C39DB9